MTLRRALSSERAVRVLRISLISSTAIVALAAVLLGIQAVSTKLQVAELRSQAVARKKEIADAQAAIARSLNSVKDDAPSGFDAVAHFQTFVDEAATREGCVLDEFKSASEMVPFLSSFESTTTAEEWQQVRVDLRLRGTIEQIVSTVRQFREVGVPFQFDNIEMNRAAVLKSGKAVVSASMQLRVLVRRPAK